MVSKSLYDERPDVIHSIFDGTSIPVFAWASAHWKIPIVGIMHTDASVILEKNNAQLIAPIILGGQKWQGSLLDSVATRSHSFAERMYELHSWKCDHVIKPHVNTDVFRPDAASANEIAAMRNELMFGADDEAGTFLAVYAGRFDLDKRIDELVKLVELVPGMYLVLVGSGALADDLALLHGKRKKDFLQTRICFSRRSGQILLLCRRSCQCIANGNSRQYSARGISMRHAGGYAACAGICRLNYPW